MSDRIERAARALAAAVDPVYSGKGWEKIGANSQQAYREEAKAVLDAVTHEAEEPRTLHDWYAGHALTGLVASNHYHLEDAPEIAHKLAQLAINTRPEVKK